MSTIYWELGAQADLADVDGALYVPGALGIRPVLRRLAEAARREGIPRLATLVSHRPDDPDLVTEGKPDYRETWPPFCLAGTPGQAWIPEARAERATEFPRDARSERLIDEALRAFRSVNAGEAITVEVPGFDPWAHLAMERILAAFSPERVVLYGIPADRFLSPAIDGLVERGIAVTVVEDAIRPLDGKKFPKEVRPAWEEKGVTFTTSGELLGAPAR